MSIMEGIIILILLFVLALALNEHTEKYRNTVNAEAIGDVILSLNYSALLIFVLFKLGKIVITIKMALKKSKDE